MNIEEEISKIRWDGSICKKYGIIEIHSIEELNLETYFVIKLNNDIQINSKNHIREIIDLLTKIKSDKRNNTINDILN